MSDIRAGVYARISHVLDDDKTKVDDQLFIGGELAGSRGWKVERTYSDNNRSAWQRNRKRPGWDALLADLKAGVINAVVVYHGDRLMRQPRDLEDLIDLADGRNIPLAAPTGTRDLSNDDDLFILRIEVAHACRSSADTSRRMKSHHDRRARKGKRATGGHGGRTFGYETDGVTHRAPDRCVVATGREESEPDVIREMARRVLAKEKRAAIGKDLAKRGWTTPAGNPLTYDRIRKILLRPDLAGLMPDGETAGAWEPILKRETWEQLQLVLASSSSAPTHGIAPARRWLLSGIALCGICGTPVRVATHGNRTKAGWEPGYACENYGACGKTYRNAAKTDAWVKGHVIGRLTREGNPEPDAPAGDDGGRWAELALERQEAEELLADAGRSRGRAKLILRRLDSIDAEMDALRRQAETTDARRLRERHRGLTAEEFDALPLDTRRALVAATVKVRIMPTRRGRGFRPEDVQVTPA